MKSEKLRCMLCGVKNEDVIVLVDDSSCFDPIIKKRLWVPKGFKVCCSHRPMQYLPGLNEKSARLSATVASLNSGKVA